MSLATQQAHLDCAIQNHIDLLSHPTTPNDNLIRANDKDDDTDSGVTKLLDFNRNDGESIHNGDENVHSDDESVNNGDENINGDGENVNSDDESVNSNGGSVNNGDENFNSDDESVNTDGENVNNDGENVNDNGENVNNDGESIMHEEENAEHDDTNDGPGGMELNHDGVSNILNDATENDGNIISNDTDNGGGVMIGDNVSIILKDPIIIQKNTTNDHIMIPDDECRKNADTFINNADSGFREWLLHQASIQQTAEEVISTCGIT